MKALRRCRCRCCQRPLALEPPQAALLAQSSHLPQSARRSGRSRPDTRRHFLSGRGSGASRGVGPQRCACRCLRSGCRATARVAVGLGRARPTPTHATQQGAQARSTTPRRDTRHRHRPGRGGRATAGARCSQSQSSYSERVLNRLWRWQASHRRRGCAAAGGRPKANLRCSGNVPCCYGPQRRRRRCHQRKYRHHQHLHDHGHHVGHRHRHRHPPLDRRPLASHPLGRGVLPVTQRQRTRAATPTPASRATAAAATSALPAVDCRRVVRPATTQTVARACCPWAQWRPSARRIGA
mmetsp:Transcript_9126/g.19932  ORF Transcript_9126/g.19932 Transcript_9126/m.19932 type:complete len:296 (+) Transcript_9126:375-1262(+)